MKRKLLGKAAAYLVQNWNEAEVGSSSTMPMPNASPRASLSAAQPLDQRQARRGGCPARPKSRSTSTPDSRLALDPERARHREHAADQPAVFVGDQAAPGVTVAKLVAQEAGFRHGKPDAPAVLREPDPLARSTKSSKSP